MNPWHNVRLMHAAANALFGLALAGVLAAAGWWLVQRTMFDLRQVSIEADEGSELRNVSTPLLRQAVRRVSGNFFTVNLDSVRAHFEKLPWVRRATARRIWPDRLVVTIEEHRPLALWGESRLINTYGETFAANPAEAEDYGPLPELSGPAGTHSMVVARWDELRHWVEPLGRVPHALKLSQRHAWTARLDDGTTLLLGRDQGLPIEARVSRWVRAYPRVQARLAEQADVVDLRYPNGFAIRNAALAPIEEEAADGVKRGAPAKKGKAGSAGGANAAVRVGYRR